MCIKNLSYITDAYLLFRVQRKETGWKIQMSYISRIGPIPKNSDYFAMYQIMRLKGTSWYRPGLNEDINT